MDTRPDIFDRSLRARRRDRMLPGFAAHDFLHRAMLDELLERLGDGAAFAEALAAALLDLMGVGTD